ncbi:MAG TPA: HlyD family efflux transporter periplasmic adaptor subunit [Gemmataceae bacterium]|nr:HlyD family efflux transporter periplasmic adaptor subunit [Gemmataceae bacterium]
MPAPWVPPRRFSHLRTFAACLGVLVLCLVGLLFGVRLEALVPASGTITARDLRAVRSLTAGLAEPGWFEGLIARPGKEPLRARVDAHGDGVTDPAQGPPRQVCHYEVLDGPPMAKRSAEGVRFHRLEPGDELWPGQVIATVRDDDTRIRLRQAEARLRDLEASSNDAAERDRARAECDALRRRLDGAVLRAPEGAGPWLAVQVRAAPLQAVRPGDVLAVIAPLDPQTRQPRDLIARLELDEKDCGDLEPGQEVRLASTMYNHRLHGHAAARLERVEPWGEAGPDGRRRFQAVAAVTDSPFPLRLGSSVRAEVVVGRKPVYRIILEH